MRCERIREAASARLDGEPLGMSAAVLDHHLAGCADCSRWLDTATRLTRTARVAPADVPDLSALIVDATALPAGRVLRRRRWLRVALLLVGVVQCAVAAPALFGTSLGMAMSMHAAHESAAWNAAIGIAFIAAAVRPRRTTGLVPLLAAFVVVLGALSIRDVAAGAVALDRLATHVAVVVGLLLVLALDRLERSLPPARVGGIDVTVERSDHRGDDRGDGSAGGGGLRTVA